MLKNNRLLLEFRFCFVLTLVLSRLPSNDGELRRCGFVCTWMRCFSHYVNSVPTQTSVHTRCVVAGSVCRLALASRWSKSGRWWGFCQTAWLLTGLLLLFKTDNQFVSVQGGATRCCSEVENKEILKMCNQDCFWDSIRSLGTTATFSWRRGLNALASAFESVSPQITSKLQRIVGQFWFQETIL